MFCSKSCNAKTDRAQKRALRAVYHRSEATLEELIILDGSKTIHAKNLQALMLEVCKSVNHMNPRIMWNLFTEKEISYSLRAGKKFVLPPTQGKTYGTYGLFFRAYLLWNGLASAVKVLNSISEFKRYIAKIKVDCGCKICSK